MHTRMHSIHFRYVKKGTRMAALQPSKGTHDSGPCRLAHFTAVTLGQMPYPGML